MSWINFNDSLNSIKGHISTFANNVLTEDDEAQDTPSVDYKKLYEDQKQEIESLRKTLNEHESQEEFGALQKTLNQKPYKIIQEDATRWNSTFYMLKRILQVKEYLCLYASTTNKIPQLTSKEWIITEKLICLQRRFEDATKELRAASVAVSSVILLIATLERMLMT
nr:unnamed protein product [Callosobruchus analis]